MKAPYPTLALALTLTFAAAHAQQTPRPSPDTEPIQTFYLNSLSQPNDPNEIVNAIRNNFRPEIKVISIPGQNAITVRATPEELTHIQSLIQELDRPKKLYRLTYTVTEMDGNKRIGVQHFAMTVVPGAHSVLKNGSRIPIVTGSYNSEKASTQKQVQYLDIGINVDATLDEFANGARLRTKVEQSSVAAETSGIGTEDPIVRQSVVEGTSFLTPGKPLTVGSLDITGSTRHLDIEVVMEVVH